jgi:hypothetical protein
MEFDLDCTDRDGIYKFLEHLKNEKIEIVHFYRMEEDLEEIFLRVLRL